MPKDLPSTLFLYGITDELAIVTPLALGFAHIKSAIIRYGTQSNDLSFSNYVRLRFPTDNCVFARVTKHGPYGYLLG